GGAAGHRRSERGSGPISTWIGFVVFLGMLLFTVQALLNLYATSVVTSVAYDAARQVAGSDGGPGAVAAAEGHARRLLGRMGDRVSFDWGATTGDDVVLRVQGRVPSVLMSPGRVLAFGEIDRTVRLRVERFR
ncbi:MAG TPA: hypothetical protein VM390_10700, partial [Acidimicrobiales bacterium]|nr:hypothetical protein [Acidimicrobiales bacterium]